MTINKNYKSTISLRDLFFHVLYRWKSILLVAVICAIGFGAYQFFYLKGIHDAGKQTEEERTFQINLQLYQVRLTDAKNKVDMITQEIEGQQEYQKESLYFNLNPQNVWIGSAEYHIEVVQEETEMLSTGSTIDPADSLLPYYLIPLGGETDQEELKEAFNTDRTEYINELVTVEPNFDSNTVSVRVLGKNQEDVEKALAYIDQRMNEISSGKAQRIKKHQLTLIGQTVALGSDKDLAEQKALQTEAMNTNIQTLMTAQDTLKALDTEKAIPQPPGTHILKMIVIGLLLGGILVTVLYILLYEFNGCLKSSEEITERYGLTILGRFRRAGVHPPVRGLNKLISSWELKDGRITDNRVLDNIASLIREKGEIQHLLLISTLPEEKLTKLQDELTARLDGKVIMTEADFLNNSEAIGKVGQADAVALVEEKDVSRMKAIHYMAENLSMSTANVIGAIIL